MDQPALVDGGQSLGQPRAEPCRGLRRERAVLGDRLLQCGAGDEGGDQPGDLGMWIGVEQLRRVEAAHLPGCLDLPREPFAEPWVPRVLGFDELDRDDPATRG